MSNWTYSSRKKTFFFQKPCGSDGTVRDTSKNLTGDVRIYDRPATPEGIQVQCNRPSEQIKHQSNSVFERYGFRAWRENAIYRCTPLQTNL
jgi:hypothetical protein